VVQNEDKQTKHSFMKLICEFFIFLVY